MRLKTAEFIVAVSAFVLAVVMALKPRQKKPIVWVLFLISGVAIIAALFAPEEKPEQAQSATTHGDKSPIQTAIVGTGAVNQAGRDQTVIQNQSIGATGTSIVFKAGDGGTGIQGGVGGRGGDFNLSIRRGPDPEIVATNLVQINHPESINGRDAFRTEVDLTIMHPCEGMKGLIFAYKKPPSVIADPTVSWVSSSQGFGATIVTRNTYRIHFLTSEKLQESEIGGFGVKCSPEN